MNKVLTWCAVGMMAFTASTSVAETIAPDDVNFEDGVVAASLTGSEGDAEAGREVFMGRKTGNCLACHANTDLDEQPFHGEVGPPMDGVADRWSADELRAIVINSKLVFGDETIMPSFYRLKNGFRTAEDFEGKTILTAEEVEDVVAYLLTLKED